MQIKPEDLEEGMTVKLPEGDAKILDIAGNCVTMKFSQPNKLVEKGVPTKQYFWEDLVAVEVISLPTSIEDPHEGVTPSIVQRFKSLTEPSLIPPAYCWLLASHRNSLVARLDGPMAIIGGGHLWSHSAMVDFALAFGLTVEPPSEHTESLIIGNEGWEGSQLETLLELQAGTTLRVYSQWMFFLFAISGIDPLDDPEMATELSGNHPAIRHIDDVREAPPPPPDELEWDWPINEPLDGAGGGGGDGIPFANKISALKMLGYTVGKTNGLPPAKRRDFLDRFFRSELPGSVEKYFPGEYGTPGSEKRLRKTANVIAAHTRNAKRNDREKLIFAIEDWEKDLEYLKTTYYDLGSFAFPWPLINPT